jgi:outer membrane lipoprotein-sorting protein
VKFLLICAVLAAGVRAESLDTIFARMDKASKEFKSATAKIHQVEYTAVIDETTAEDGQLFMKRAHGNVMLRVNFDKPNQRVVALDGHMVSIYKPMANTVEKYDVSKYTSSNTVEQLLLLSFGAASSAELKKNYTVTGGETEKIDSTMTTRVVLVPKSGEMRKEVLRITLWIPEGKSYAIKERVDKPGKDYVAYIYTDVNVNRPVPDSDVMLKLPHNVHVVGGK